MQIGATAMRNITNFYPVGSISNGVNFSMHYLKKKAHMHLSPFFIGICENELQTCQAIDWFFTP